MKNTRTCLSAFALVLTLIMPGVRAIAQESPCAADAAKFCKDLKDQARKDCMKSHEADLSDACRLRDPSGKEKPRRIIPAPLMRRSSARI